MVVVCGATSGVWTTLEVVDEVVSVAGTLTNEVVLVVVVFGAGCGV